MRALIFVVPVLCSAAISTALVGCDDTASKSGGGDAASATPDMAVSAPACAPSASCPAADKSCIGSVDNAGKDTFGLRMSALAITAPVAVSRGVVKSVFAGNTTPHIPECNLNGAATLSWLLQFDTRAGTLKTGGARPSADVKAGYAFDDETIQQGPNSFHIQPITFPSVTPDASGNFSVMAGKDLLFPIFLDQNANAVVLFPLHEARIASGTLSQNHNCIGRYNAEGLDPGKSCQPDATHPQFINGGTVDGYLTLEDTDIVIIAPLRQSLCVVLAGDAATYGQPMGNNTVCKRDGNQKIVFKGDWCAANNSAATANCFDAMHFTADFAASSILINN